MCLDQIIRCFGSLLFLIDWSAAFDWPTKGKKESKPGMIITVNMYDVYDAER